MNKYETRIDAATKRITAKIIELDDSKDTSIRLRELKLEFEEACKQAWVEAHGLPPEGRYLVVGILNDRVAVGHIPKPETVPDDFTVCRSLILRRQNPDLGKDETPKFSREIKVKL